MKYSPLFDAQQAAGATFHPTPGGWEMPAFFEDPNAEVRRVRAAAGVADLSHRGKVRLLGRDRLSFLHAILSQDLASLPTGRSAYATLLDPTGHVLSDLWVHAEPDSLLLDLEPGRAGSTQEALDKYLFRERVMMSDVTDDVALLTLQGPAAAQSLESALPDLPELGEDANATLDTPGGSVLVCAHSRTGERGFDLFAGPEAANRLWRSLLDVGAAPTGLMALDILRIEAGIPRFGQDFGESNIVLEAGIPHAISLTKGCYVGQEIVARIDSRGHTNRLLRGLRFEGGEAPDLGAPIAWQGKTVGAISSATVSPTLAAPIALAIIRHEASAAGTSVAVGSANRPAVMADLPFVSGGPGAPN